MTDLPAGKGSIGASVSMCLVVLTWLAGSGPAAAQSGQARPEFWDVEIGTLAADIPLLDFQDHACGTNGGPPGRRLEGFGQFNECAPEANGLHEVHFRYDDEAEYVALARELDGIAEQLQGNKVLGAPAITSVLIDGDGVIRGLRAVTDPRASLNDRSQAYKYRRNFRARFGLDGWACVEGAPDERRSPVGENYVDERCEKRTADYRVVVEGRLFRKAGQAAFDRTTGEATVGQFESSARLEVYDLRGDEPESDAPRQQASQAAIAGQAKDCPGCDLHDARLKRRDLSGADLAGADLRAATLHRADLSRANLSGANLKNANLNEANLRKADLTGANLEGALLYEADLSGAVLDRAVLTSARLQHARLIQTKLPEAKLQTVYATGARFDGADLRGAMLDGSLFESADFQRADLTGADLRGSTFMGARFTAADLTRTKADQTDFLEADFMDAVLSDAHWRNSRLERAVTTGADLADVELSGSILPDGSVAP